MTFWHFPSDWSLWTKNIAPGFISVFSRANGKPQRPIRAKKDIYFLDKAEFIDRGCSLLGMNKGESKVKMGINYGKSSLQMSPKTMVNCYNDFQLHQFSPSGSAVKFSGAKKMLLQASISWRALALTQVFTRAPTTFLHLNRGIPTLLSDSWTSMRDSLTNGWNPGGAFLAAPSSTQRSQLCFFLLLLLLLLLILHVKFELVNL